jgi:hypothetical protein
LSAQFISTQSFSKIVRAWGVTAALAAATGCCAIAGDAPNNSKQAKPRSIGDQTRERP